LDSLVTIAISQEPFTRLAEYARIPIAFRVERVLDIISPESLRERVIAAPYEKDYDVLDPPVQWPTRFDVRNWALFFALSDGRPVGGAIVARDTPDLRLLEGRTDLAVLWDIRVHSDVRHRGVGSTLLRGVETWAVSKGCCELKIETQDINVPACRFYARHGCLLRAINRHAYPEFPHEVQLFWYKDLRRVEARARC
jgi:GNAT superfamily N-acetyltransferase